MTCDRLLVHAYCALVCVLAWLGPTEAWAQGGLQGPNCNVAKGQILPEGCSVQRCTDKDGKLVPCPEKILPGSCPLPPGCDLKNPSTYGICTSGAMSLCRCASMPDMRTSIEADGTFCVPTKACRSHSAGAPNSLGMNDPTCKRFPISPKNSVDPNDKVGTLGVADQGF